MLTLLGGTLLAFLFFRIPEWTHMDLRNEWALPYVAFLFFIPLMTHHRSRAKTQKFMGLMGLLLLVLALTIGFNNHWGTFYESDWGERGLWAFARQVKWLMIIHLPLLMLGLMGWLYTSNSGNWLGYLKDVTQVALIGILVSGGAMIFMGISTGLLHILAFSYLDEILVNLGVVVACSMPFVAHHIWVKNTDVIERVIPALTKLFIPMFVLSIGAFLVIYLFSPQDLRGDRDDLIVFNVLILAVVALLFGEYALRSGKNKPWMQWMLVGFVGLTVVADGIGLWAIASRLWDFGLTPNRLAVLVGNVLILAHLLMMLPALLPGKGAGLVKKRLTQMLPIYFLWTAVVVVVFPWVFAVIQAEVVAPDDRTNEAIETVIEPAIDSQARLSMPDEGGFIGPREMDRC